jgi:hypothetical protein
MRRLLALVTVAAAVASATPASAKPYTYSDAKGDSPAGAALDIVGVTYSTEGITSVRKVGRKSVRTYEPTKLVVTLALAGAPMQQPGIRYQVSSQVAECGAMTFTYAPALGDAALTTSDLSVGCGGPAGTTGGDTLFLAPKLTIKGSKLIWSVPLKSLPKVARAGALHYGFTAGVDLVEPVLATLGPDDAGSAAFDTATTDGDWEVS